MTLDVSGGPAVLMGARDGRRTRLRDIEGSTEIHCEDWDWLWLESSAPIAANWSIRCPVRLPQVTVVMPTMRREQDACAQIARFLSMDLISRILVIDQAGTLGADRRLRDLADPTGKVDLITQPNLGGSGGYARGMLASLSRPRDAVLLSDDDAVLSEESLRRMVLLQSLSTVPTIVGTPLFDAAQSDRLMAHSERVDPRSFQWGPADGLRGSRRLGASTPDQWSFLERRRPSNFTGWWGTLLPPGAIASIGLPAPFFLKWDDAEYGLRAVSLGFSHTVLPGTAVHHPSWTAHGTQMTWTAQVMHRNRLATAAGRGHGPRGVIASSLLHQVKHVLAGHHLTATLWAAGIDSYLAGPESWLGTDLLEARAEAQSTVAAWREAHGEAGRALEPTERGALGPVRGSLRALRLLSSGPRPSRHVIQLLAKDVTWRSTLGANGVIVLDGTGRRIDAFAVSGTEGRRILARTLRQHLAMALRHGSLRRRYRRALRSATSPEAWERTFSRRGPVAGRTADLP